MRKLLFCSIIMFSICVRAQVGVNTTDPKALLDIKSSNQANPSATDGILVPKIDTFPATNPGVDQQGMLVYLTTAVGGSQPGFYYWNNSTTWTPIGNNSNSTWNLNGNASTIPGTNFIGTTDNQDFILKRNNAISGRIGVTHTSFGFNSSLFNTATSTAFGATTLQQNSGTGNSAFGYQTLRGAGNGSNNAALGTNTLRQNTTGSNNSALGFEALLGNTVGSNNTALGFKADVATINLSNATAIGSRARVGADNSLVLGSINGINGATSNVNVGIGTTTPQNRLHLNTNSTTEVLLLQLTNPTTGSGVLNGLLLGLNPSGEVGIFNNFNGRLLFGTSNFPDMLLNNGNLGIGGLFDPLEKLHVIGNIRMVDGNQASGKILVSDANGTASWSDVSSANGWGINGNSGTDDTVNFLGTIDAEDLVFKTSNLDVGRFTSDGKFRLGMTTVSDNWRNFSKMEIGSDDAVNDFTLRSSGTDALALNMVHSGGTMSSPTIPNVGEEIGSLRFWAYNQTGAFSGYSSAGRITSFVKVSSVGNVDTALQLSSTGGSILIDDLGNVGVGTNTPSRKLHIVNNGLSGGTPFGTAGIVLESSAQVYQQFLTPSNRESGLLFGNQTGSIRGGIVFNSGISDGLSFRTGGNITRMTITGVGDVGIGTLSPGGQFELTLDEGRKPGTSTWTIVSDQRLKTIHGNYTKGLSEILQLNPIRFNYKDAEGRKFDHDVLNTEFSGFIAQDVQQIFPEAVGTDDDGYLNLNMHPILIAAINALKELNIEIQKKNKDLETENRNQNIIIQELLKRIENLEKRQSLND